MWVVHRVFQPLQLSADKFANAAFFNVKVLSFNTSLKIIVDKDIEGVDSIAHQ